jgi:hypothetical protein
MRHKKTKTARGRGTGAAGFESAEATNARQSYCSKFPSPCQSPIEQLREQAKRAKEAGDYAGYCRLRQAFLNAQAAAYTGGVQ